MPRCVFNVNELVLVVIMIFVLLKDENVELLNSKEEYFELKNKNRVFPGVVDQ